MTSAMTAGFDTVLEAIERSRRAQKRQNDLIREDLARMVTSHEFTAAMAALGEWFKTIEELMDLRSDRLSEQLATIIDRLP